MLIITEKREYGGSCPVEVRDWMSPEVDGRAVVYRFDLIWFFGVKQFQT